MAHPVVYGIFCGWIFPFFFSQSFIWHFFLFLNAVVRESHSCAVHRPGHLKKIVLVWILLNLGLVENLYPLALPEAYDVGYTLLEVLIGNELFVRVLGMKCMIGPDL